MPLVLNQIRWLFYISAGNGLTLSENESECYGNECSKKVVSSSLRLLGVAVGQVDSDLYLPDRQVKLRVTIEDTRF